MPGLMKTFACAALAFSTVASPAFAEHIDFSQYAAGTPITIVRGTTFSLSGGPNTATTPVATGVFGNSRVALTNADTNNYPTSRYLTAVFQSAASGISFTFNNYGSGNGSSYSAYDAFGGLVSSANIDFSNDYTNLIAVSGSNIKSLVWSNGSDGESSWQYGIGELNFTASAVTAAPEPGTWLMMILGFGVIGLALRRGVKVSEENFTRKVRAIAAG